MSLVRAINWLIVLLTAIHFLHDRHWRLDHFAAFTQQPLNEHLIVVSDEQDAALRVAVFNPH
jgi:hypothetical protein